MLQWFLVYGTYLGWITLNSKRKNRSFISLFPVALIYQHCSFWITGNVCSKIILLLETVLHTSFLSTNQHWRLSIWLFAIPWKCKEKLSVKWKRIFCWLEYVKMEFCYQNCSDLLWPTMRKVALVIEKTFEIRGWRPRSWKIFEITRTIFSNSGRSEQFLVTECFLKLFLEISHI